MKKLLIFIIFFLSFTPVKADAYCSASSFDRDYKNAFTIFSGEIIDGVGSPTCGPQKVLFRVMDVYKGKLSDEVWIYKRGYCRMSVRGMKLTAGVQYMIYAGRDVDTGRLIAGGGCSRSGPLATLHDSNRASLIEKMEQTAAFDNAIQASPDLKLSLLKSKAEHLLHWQDYTKAKDTFREILEETPNDSAIYMSLLRTLYKLDKVEDIWALYNKNDKRQDLRSHERNEMELYVSYAMLKLGKEIGPRQRYRLKDTKLKNVNLEGRTLKQPWFKDVTFTNINMKKATMTGGHLTKVKFYQGDLSDATFKNVTMEDVSFSSLSLKNTDFSEVTFNKIKLQHANISGMSFKDAKISDGYFYRVNLKDTDFSNAEIHRSRLSWVDFSNANLKGISLLGSEYDCYVQWPKGFNPEKAGAFRKQICPEKESSLEIPPKYVESLKTTWFIAKDFRGHKSIKKDLQGKNLKNANFSEVDMRKTRFDYSNLTGSNFTWANISSSEFKKSQIENTHFNYANLIRAEFSNQNIKNTSFKSAMLSGAEFKNINVSNTSFADSSLVQAEFIKATLHNMDFSGANMRKTITHLSEFSNSNFKNADLYGLRARSPRLNGTEKTIFKNVNFEGASLNESDVKRADFTGSTFKNATLFLARYDCNTIWPKDFNPGKKGAILADKDCQDSPHFPAILKGKDLSYKDLSKLTLKGADLSNANLRGSDLSASDLSTANLKGADLTLSQFDCGTTWPENFNPIKAGAYLKLIYDLDCTKPYGPPQLENKNLSGEDLSSAPFTKANLRKANLSKTSMKEAGLFKADLSGADLRGTDLTKANLRKASVKGALYNCNTLWPDNYKPNTNGARQDKAPCTKHSKEVMAGNWRKPKATKNIVIEDKEMPWFYTSYKKPLENITYKNVLLRGATFGKVKLEKVKFINSDLRNATFKGTELIDVDFSGSDIRGASFEDVSFKGVVGANIIYDCHTKGTALRLPNKECEE